MNDSLVKTEELKKESMKKKEELSGHGVRISDEAGFVKKE